LAAYTGQAKYEEPAHEALSALQSAMSQYPGAFTYWLGSLEFALASPKEVALIGPLESQETQALLQTLQSPYRPNQVVAVASPGHLAGHPALVEGRPMQNGSTTAYVCQRFTCQRPVTTVAELEQLLTE
jgi:uncharacterized protein